MNSNKLYKFCIAVFLLVLIICRLCVSEENCLWISMISFIGVLVSVVDLYNSIKLECKKSKKSHPIILSFVFLILVFIVILSLMFTNVIKVDNKWNDIFTLLALFVGLPKDIYCDLAKRYINK